ncbi:porin family protein [Pedobacter metabolipauper]|uniref:Outer membrane protein with beta-barrel domain n=1 Tax=Pedobacter metabolipauper TaxID=425513 RepID=A0A4R6SUU5_9SPHI|nr:porin family protein [Pedobacter metabolipauper]TDQ08209.1 outer membrane protein with beta-barrel domain [Pedobacter metabolipauper]
MKTKTLLVVLVMYGLCASAQESPEKRIRFGLKAGVNGSLFTKAVDPFDDFDRRGLSYFRRFFRASGFGGVTLDAELSPRISIGAEGLFTSKGMAYREQNDAVIIIDSDGQEQQAYNYYNFNVDYLELPLTINYNFSQTSNLFLTTYAGFAPAINIAAKTKLRYEGDVNGDGRKTRSVKDKLDHVNHFNNSLIAGLKVGDSVADKPAIFLDFRTSYLLNPVFNRSRSDNGNNLDTHMLSFSLGFGVKF